MGLRDGSTEDDFAVVGGWEIDGGSANWDVIRVWIGWWSGEGGGAAAVDAGSGGGAAVVVVVLRFH